jgi:23S rRNA (guanosine2251-2'-O)-methyltransferase
VLEALRAGRSLQRVMLGKGVRLTGVAGEIRRRAENAGVPVRIVPREELDRIAPSINHQGVVARTARFRYMPLERLLEHNEPLLLFLDGVMDPQNLGSLLRSAEGAGFDGVVLPAHRAAGITATVRRVSAGAAEVVPVARVKNLSRALDQAREAGVWIVGLDAGGEADIWTTDLAEPPVGIVCGSEDRGLSRSVAKRCDELVRIPCSGQLRSLNVAVAGAIAMFEVTRRRQASTSNRAFE